MAGDGIQARAIWASGEMPLGSWAKFASSRLDDIHDHMIRAFCPHDLATEGGLPRMAFRHNQASLKSTTFNATDYGLSYGRVSVFIPPPEECFLVQFVLTGQAHFVHQDRSFALHPGHMSVLSPHDPIRQTTLPGCRHFTIKIDRGQIEGLLAEEFGHQVGSLIFSPDPVPLDGAAASFAQLVRTICDDIDLGASGYLHPRAVGTTEEMLGRLLLASVPHNYSHDYLRDPAQTAAPFYVRRAEELIRARFADPLTLADLIAASGVSGRSLHDGFRRFRDDSPMGFLKNYRLDRARQMLKEARGSGLSVTDVSLAAGFLHPSKFAQDYARRFGELPSRTLKH
ncbi:AraC family transcriptional regulator [Flavisphingomonas formosensis]|uniref:AraC family transcriptional regulator n=1 Tax=Flavisphingomonas formosensis TaxID=861534 RepID=UPI001E2A22C6|nr:AraC family transcriptional regulator [Sphingomonas formosensis]